MSSEHLASAQTEFKGDLGASWNILDGASANYTDLGVARRFSGAAGAYSLRDIGAMNKEVVKVRRDVDGQGSDPEENFSANQVQSGGLEDWVNGKLETILPADVEQAEAAFSLRKVSEGKLVYTGDYSSDTNNIAANTGGVTVTGNNDSIFGKDNVLKIENDANAAPQLSCSNGSYQSSESGVVEFEYYVPSDHPIVGNFWHIGTQATSSPSVELAYTKEGVQIVGGAWTTAKLFYGSLYGGVDKPNNFADGGRRFITILDQRVADGKVDRVSAQDGDIWYLSSATIKTYDAKPVRIRRTSDNIEVEVFFDSDDKVSLNSPVLNRLEEGRTELGKTTATDLNGFLNEKLTVGVAVPGGASASDRPDSFTNATNSSFTATVTDTAGGYFPYKSASGDAVTVSFDLVVSGGASPSINTSLGVDTVDTRAAGTAYNSSGSYTFTLNCNASADHIRFADSDDGTFAITNFTIVSHTHQATVNTWYDQAKSNDAVQPTSLYQPTIAEDGALLANGLKFDGSDDFLQTDGQVLTNDNTGPRSLYGVCNINADSGYIFGDATNGTDEGTSFYSDTASDKIFFTNGKSGTLTTFDNITTIEGLNILLSANYNNNNTTTIHKNSNNNGYTEGTGAYNFNASSKFTIGDREGGSSAATKFDGSIQEVIAYNTRQSDNRFKIESNINNHYGLYDDEYEWHSSNTEWQNSVEDGTTTFTPNGKDGFTITATGENIANFKFAYQAPSSAINNYYKISFVVDDPDGLFDTAQLRTTATGSGATAISIDNGFNAFKLKTPGNGNFVSFNMDANGSTKTATLSNFKISLVNRLGQVRTWYDQSGSNNLFQAVATKQPFIVELGGLCRMHSGNAAVKGTRYSNGEIDFLEMTNTVAEPTTIFATFYTNRSFGLLHCGTNIGASPYVKLNTNGIHPLLNSSDDMGTTSATNTVDGLLTLFSAENGGDAVLRKDGTQIDTLTRTAAEDRPIGFLFRHQSSIDRKGVFLDTYVIFNEDKTSDFVEIESELKIPNNIS